jgi:hypothetical protein
LAREGQEAGYSFVGSELEGAVSVGSRFHLSDKNLNTLENHNDVVAKKVAKYKKWGADLRDLSRCKDHACIMKTLDSVSKEVAEWLEGYLSEGVESALERLKKADGFLRGYSRKLGCTAERHISNAAECSGA